MWQAKEKEIFSFQRRKQAQEWSGELLKCKVKTRMSPEALLYFSPLQPRPPPWCPSSLAEVQPWCRQEDKEPGESQLQTANLIWDSHGGVWTLSHSTKHCWVTAKQAPEAGPRMDDEILLWVKTLIFPERQCYTRHVCSSFTATACLCQALLSQALAGISLAAAEGLIMHRVAKYSSCSSCSDWTFFLEPQHLANQHHLYLCI